MGLGGFDFGASPPSSLEPESLDPESALPDSLDPEPEVVSSIPGESIGSQSLASFSFFCEPEQAASTNAKPITTTRSFMAGA